MVNQVLDQDLKAKGLKVTLPRMKVLSVLSCSGDGAPHLSAEEVYNQLLAQGEEVSLATVYRVLTQFESAGLVIRHCFDGERAVYELADGENHNHIVCIRCAGVAEFVDATLLQYYQAIADNAGYLLNDHNLVLYGVCKQCQ